MSTRAIAELPLSTRNYTQILNLSIGVVAGVSDASAFGRGDQHAYGAWGRGLRTVARSVPG